MPARVPIDVCGNCRHFSACEKKHRISANTRACEHFQIPQTSVETTPKRERMISRLGKLLERVNDESSSEAEREKASRAAAKLQTEYSITGIDLRDVGGSYESEGVKTLIRVRKTADWVSLLVASIADLTRTESLIQPVKAWERKTGKCPVVYVFGTPHNCDLFRYYLHLIIRQVERMMVKRCRGKDTQDQYAFGVVVRVSERLKAMKETQEEQVVDEASTALVLRSEDQAAAQALSKFLASHNFKVDNLLSTTRVSLAGYRDGDGVSLNTALKGSPNPTKKITG